MPSPTSDPDADGPVQSDEREDGRRAADAPGDVGWAEAPNDRRSASGSPGGRRTAPAHDADLQAVIDHYERLLAAREREARGEDGDPTRPWRPGAIARLVRWLRSP